VISVMSPVLAIYSLVWIWNYFVKMVWCFDMGYCDDWVLR
jgi:hypothetical protein